MRSCLLCARPFGHAHKLRQAKKKKKKKEEPTTKKSHKNKIIDTKIMVTFIIIAQSIIINYSQQLASLGNEVPRFSPCL